MEAYLKAGVFLHDDVVRYTEITVDDAGRAGLKRLGSCRFDFSVVSALTDGNPELVETLREALTDVFEGSAITEVCIALDPSICYTFHTAVEGDATEESMRRQLLAEIALVSDPETPLHVSSGAIGSTPGSGGGVVSNLQVLAFPDSVRANLDIVLADIPGTRQFYSSVQGAGNLLKELLRGNATDAVVDPEAFDIAVGQYETYAEYSVCRSGQLLHVQHVQTTGDEEILYYAANLLRTLGAGEASVNRVYLYGEGLTDESRHAFARVLGDTQLLDPLSVVPASGNPRGAFDGRSFVQCVGVALSPLN